MGVAAPVAGVQDDGLFLPVPVHIVEGEGGAVAAALGILKFDVLAVNLSHFIDTAPQLA